MKTILATISFPRGEVTQEWELLQAHASGFLVVFRLRDETPFVIPLESSRISVKHAERGKFDMSYTGPLNVANAYLLKRE